MYSKVNQEHRKKNSWLPYKNSVFKLLLTNTKFGKFTKKTAIIYTINQSPHNGDFLLMYRYSRI